MDRWKSRGGQSQRREEQKREDQRRERQRGKKMQVCEKVAKPRNIVFFQWFVAPEGRKVGSLKRRVRRHLVRWEMKKLHAVVARSKFPSQNAQNTPGSDHFWELRCGKKWTPLWREAHFEVKSVKNWQSRTAFGRWDVEKVHAVVAGAVVAGSTFPSQNPKKHTSSKPRLEVEMSKKCTLLWREAHFEFKSVRNWQSRTAFGRWDVEKVHAVVAGSTFPSQNSPAPDHVWKLRCRKSARCCGAKHMSKSKVEKNWGVRSTFGRSDVVCVPGTRNFAPCQKWAKHEGFVAVSTTTTTTLHYTTLHYTTLHYTTLHSTTPTTTTTTT